ncbi:MAG TPA: diadenylate cyclase, partial [Clostridia bacterium]|nr:diadenylate cyclase [Clostridia bacterium]
EERDFLASFPERTQDWTPMGRRAVRAKSPSNEEILSRELVANNVHLDDESLASPEAFLAELGIALKRPIHECNIAPYGCLFTDDVRALDGITVIELEPSKLELVRQLADGIRTFVVFGRLGFVGLGIIEEGADELRLVEFITRNRDSVIITADTYGVTKLLQASGITIHQQRQWRSQPAVSGLISKVVDVAPMANRVLLSQLLHFAAHTLSPRGIGATLVWCLAEPTQEELAKMKPSIDLSDFRFSLSSKPIAAILRHHLSLTDGATIFDPEGIVIGTGAHLRVSDASVAFIKQFRGTRHTSAKRFSYDLAKALIVTISADGPVTVFSDGLSIAELSFSSAHQAARALASAVPEKRDDISGSSHLEQCSKCGKTSRIEEVVISGFKDREEANCPVCGEVLYSAMCFTLNSHIVKQF